jgi:energy-coupling factor transporter ATP-binding protein EcfA2
MKVISLQLSNILSFKYVDDIGNAEKISFDDGLNIIIGENGSGKSTALEVVNFLFRRVLYKQYTVNQDLYTQRNTIDPNQRRQILAPANVNSYNGFRLDPNWNTEDKPQTIRIAVKLDDIDKNNIQFLQDNRATLAKWAEPYTLRGVSAASAYSETYTFDVTMNRNDRVFSVQPRDCAQDFGYEYLTDYNFYKEAIALFNLSHADNPIAALYESFTLISGYRNYNAFTISISLRDHHPAAQIQQIRNADYSRSLNASESSEPSIFALVRLQVAEKHFGLISKKMDASECEAVANTLPFILEINKRLRIVNLMCKIKLLDLRTWQ